MTRLVVADTTVWSNFAHAGDPRLVQAAFPSVSSPPGVVEELDRGHRLGYVLTDDRAARKTARLLGVRLSGTLGVLARLVDAGRISVAEADQLLGAMLRSGYRSPISSISELL